MTSSEETVQSLQTLLTCWIEEETRTTGTKPSKAQIEAHSLYTKQTRLMMALAPAQAPEACAAFVRRKARFCTKKRSEGDRFCGLHRAEQSVVVAAAGTTAPNQSGIGIGIGRKKNVKRRMKKMLNPFTVPETPSTKLPNWSAAFTDITRPLWLDIGCAKGRYLMSLNNKHSSSSSPEWRNQQWNFCGVELFAPLVHAANSIVNQQSITNLFYVHANINKDIERLDFPNLQRVSYLFPDPWSCGENATQKNVKKRVMNPEFAMSLARLLSRGGEVYFATDWLDLALDIRKCLLGTNCFDIPSISSSNTSSNTIDDSYSDTAITATSHIAKYPYIPTLLTSHISTNQSSIQTHISTHVAKEALIDTATNFAKPEVKSDEDIAREFGLGGGEPVLWLKGIPFDGVQTERDLVCEAQWRAVYRLVVVRNSVEAATRSDRVHPQTQVGDAGDSDEDEDIDDGEE